MKFIAVTLLALVAQSEALRLKSNVKWGDEGGDDEVPTSANHAQLKWGDEGGDDEVPTSANHA